MAELQVLLVENLTELEFWIAFGTVSGASIEDLADKLDYSEANIRYYLTKIFRKLLIPDECEEGKRERLTSCYQGLIRAYGNDLLFAPSKKRWVRKPFNIYRVINVEDEDDKFFFDYVYRRVFNREPPSS